MIEMADKKKRGYVDEESFVCVMREVGLIIDSEETVNPNLSLNQQKKQEALERALKLQEAER